MGALWTLRQWWEHVCVLFTFQSLVGGVWAPEGESVCVCVCVCGL